MYNVAEKICGQENFCIENKFFAKTIKVMAIDRFLMVKW